MKNQINWLLSTFDKKSYSKGLQAIKSEKNPFSIYSNAWFSWNKGYNEKNKKS